MTSSHRRRSFTVEVLSICLLFVSLQRVSAATFSDPPTLSSVNGQLSVLVIAGEHTQAGLVSPSGQNFSTVKFWTYQVCLLPNPQRDPAPAVPSCPTTSPSYSNLGSVRFALQQGDTFRLRLVNKLPKVSVSQVAHVADYPPLALNPTNMHTHGFIVDPHNANNSPTDPYGDFVLLELPPAGVEYTSPVPHGTIINDGNNYVDYLYVIEPDHPSGLYWLHPHLHGISLNQVSAGMGDIATIGTPVDYCNDDSCVTAVTKATKRHLVLKDTQVLPTGLLQTQQVPAFCGLVTTITTNLGACPAAAPSTGTWIHTVSGQLYPSINVGADGDVWEIVNASGGRDYQLALGNPATSANIPLQILAIDGVTISVNRAATSAAVATLIADKLTVVPCPGATSTGAICASRIRMMPSSRVAVRVFRPDSGAAPLPEMLYTSMFNTGLSDFSTGDQWPAMGLAAVTLATRNIAAPTTVATRDVTATTIGANSQLQSAPTARAPDTTTLTTASATTAAAQTTSALVPACPALPANSFRRIKFGYPTPTTFGLGTEIADLSGGVSNVTPIRQFNPTVVTVCVPVPSNGQAYEVWELQNYTPEDHNFHIHQTKFFVVAGGLTPGFTIPKLLNGNLVLHDNVPVPKANQAGCSGAVGDLCTPTSVFIVVPFHEIGDFVFHCHILEHEDGGMMARIHVQPGT